jgi:Arc/MetJ-type ribon-helix-helix transcriptional regulator
MSRIVKEKIMPTREWTSVSMPIEYIDYILEAVKKTKSSGSVSEFVRDAIREKLAMAEVPAPLYETVIERYELIVE